MNDYMRLLAHAAVKYTGQPAVLSPLLDSYCGWENKKTRLSSEPAKNDTRIILSTSGLVIEELKVDYDGCLKVCMQHGNKELGEKNFKWSRDCTYEYVLNQGLVPLLSVYWTSDEFLVIQARDAESSFAEDSGVKGLEKFQLLPIDLINVLEPALNVPFVKQMLKAIKKKSSEISSYVSMATEVPGDKDVLSLLKCVPLAEDKIIAYESLMEGPSQDDAPMDTNEPSEQNVGDKKQEKKQKSKPPSKQ